MMGTYMVPETSVYSYNQLKRLTARECFMKFSRRENFKSDETENVSTQTGSQTVLY
jgi:hypothetical protein